MNFSEYQEGALQTSSATGDDIADLMYFALGLCGEAGEVGNLIKKVARHGKTLDPDKLKEELGDVLWYVAAVARAANINLGDIAEFNLAKLRERYPGGFVARGDATPPTPEAP